VDDGLFGSHWLEFSVSCLPTILELMAICRFWREIPIALVLSKASRRRGREARVWERVQRIVEVLAIIRCE
jgi:hypothetical protein